MRFLQHFFNPVHVYCRLRDCHIPKPIARRLASAWERYIYAYPRMAVVALAALVVLTSCALPAQARHLHKERIYQDAWCAAQGGMLEVRLPGGLRIDCETATHAVEVDFASKWAEAVGQCLAYAGATGKHPGILLILEHPSDSRYLDKLRQTIAVGGLPIDVWTITPGEVAR